MSNSTVAAELYQKIVRAQLDTFYNVFSAGKSSDDVKSPDTVLAQHIQIKEELTRCTDTCVSLCRELNQCSSTAATKNALRIEAEAMFAELPPGVGVAVVECK